MSETGLELTAGEIHLPGGRVHKVRPGGRVQVPVALAHLDVDDDGIAMPWCSPLARPGEIDLDKAAVRQVRAMREQLCGICGFDLDYRKCFHVRAVTEDGARSWRNMTSPAMHLTCSAYVGDATDARADVDDDGQAWWRYSCRSYKIRSTADGQLVAVAAPATAVGRL